MKKTVLVLIMGLLLIGVNLYAADGDLIVDGKVGIGTTSPDPNSKLDVNGIAQIPTLKGSSASGGNLTLQSTSNVTKGKILFGNSAYNEVNNRLGIGTTAPGQLLHITGPGNVGTKFQRQDNTKYLFFDWTPQGSLTPTNVQWGMGMLPNSNNFSYWIWDGSVNKIPLTITNTGNVGIGETNPQSKLAVNGLPNSAPDTSGTKGILCITNNGNIWVDDDGTYDCQ